MTDAPSPESQPLTPPSAPSPATRAWMDRLTVPHAYDPETGFIVAKATTPLPPILASAPPLDLAIEQAARESRVLVAFATADRCAPCQQYKKDALSDPRVVARLQSPRLLATHIEVDKAPELAERYLGSRAIPMTYALACAPPDPSTTTHAATPISTLRGQRTPDELIAWLDALLAKTR